MVIIMLLMTALQILIESLPVSSSGHLTLFEYGYYLVTGQIVAMPAAYEYMLHGPTIIMLAVYFRKRWWFLVRHMWQLRLLIIKACMLVLCADGITVPLHLLLYRNKTAHLPLWVGFFVTGMVLISLYWCKRDMAVPLTVKHACIIGIVQGISGSGISRLASTYTAGVWLGLSPRTSFYFSCMVQWPLIVVGFLGGLWEMRHDTALIAFFMQWWVMLFMVACALGAYFLLAWVEWCMKTWRLWLFGIYLLFLALVTLLLDTFCFSMIF